MRPQILISNDDGHGADGIVALTEAMRPLGDVHVYAPAENFSGASSALTLNKSIGIREPEKVHGTPTDAVHFGIKRLKHKNIAVDLTVTGINAGSNLGDDTIYSGTVGAAIESVLLGVPAVAFSLAPLPGGIFPPVHFDAAAKIATKLIAKLLAVDNLPRDRLYNVNIPDVPLEQMGKFAVNVLGRRHQAREILLSDDKKSFSYVMTEHYPDNQKINADFEAVKKHKIAVTPLIIDLTGGKHLFDELEQWLP